MIPHIRPIPPPPDGYEPLDWRDRLTMATVAAVGIGVWVLAGITVWRWLR